MKITSIKPQLRKAGRYSVFVEGKYCFSLSGSALLDSKIVNGQELTAQQVAAYKQLSNDDQLYIQTINFIAIRLRTRWEIAAYLKRKNASPALIDSILNKLSINNLIDDEKFAKAFVNDRQLLKPTSRRKIILELRKKHISDAVIQKVTSNENSDEQTALQAIITNKRRQTRYQDDLKLMQYLARQGFSYGDIKSAIKNIQAEEL